RSPRPQAPRAGGGRARPLLYKVLPGDDPASRAREDATPGGASPDAALLLHDLLESRAAVRPLGGARAALVVYPWVFTPPPDGLHWTPGRRRTPPISRGGRQDTLAASQEPRLGGLETRSENRTASAFIPLTSLPTEGEWPGEFRCFRTSSAALQRLVSATGTAMARAATIALLAAVAWCATAVPQAYPPPAGAQADGLSIVRNDAAASVEFRSAGLVVTLRV